MPLAKSRDKKKSFLTKDRNLKSCRRVNIWLSESYGNTVVEKVESDFKLLILMGCLKNYSSSAGHCGSRLAVNRKIHLRILEM